LQPSARREWRTTFGTKTFPPLVVIFLRPLPTSPHLSFSPISRPHTHGGHSPPPRFQFVGSSRTAPLCVPLLSSPLLLIYGDVTFALVVADLPFSKCRKSLVCSCCPFCSDSPSAGCPLLPYKTPPGHPGFFLSPIPNTLYSFCEERWVHVYPFPVSLLSLGFPFLFSAFCR